MTVEQMDLLACSPTERVLEDTAGRSHRNGTRTERDAAQKIRGGTHKARILSHLARVGAQGATAHELWQATGGAFPHVAATRCLDLLDLGLVERTGATRKTPSGDDALLWFANDRGRQVANEMRGTAA